MTDDKPQETDKYKYCNHHHELTDNHEMVTIGGNEFVANKKAIPLLKALNDVGLKTRSHHIDKPDENAFVCILMDNIHTIIMDTLPTGEKQLCIQWEQEK